jgi:iron complex outermembrane recepter protein
MKAYWSFLSLLFFLFPCCVNGQVVKGRVLDSTNGDPLFAATVGEKGTSNGISTDFNGEFSLKLSQLPATLLISLVGYTDKEVLVQAVDKRLEIQLSPNTQEIKPVEIVSDRILEKQKKNPLSVESMDAIAIKETPAANFYEGLSALKGVDMASASLAFRVINTRGFNSTSPVRLLQLIDGVDNQSPGLNFSLGNFLGAPDLDIKSVEVVQGASSAFFGPGAFNGVVRMETKNPFFFKGLTTSLKVGERNLVEPVIRWADSFVNKNKQPFFAYKINVYYLQARDWEANNYTPIYGSPNGASNPGRYDAVNIYGDEYFPGNNFSSASPWTYKGIGTFYRTGYKEEDLLDYSTKNFKTNAALHFRLKPEMDYASPELILQTNISNGTTVYQGDNRFRLKDIFFMQNRIELTKKDKYFVRVYMTKENAGKSYDPYFTALKIRDEARSNEDWAKVYEAYWRQKITPKIDNLGYPELSITFPGPVISFDYDSLVSWLNYYQDSLTAWHTVVEGLTNNGNANILGIDANGYYQPGSTNFNAAFNRVTGLKNNDGEGGTRFYDKSALYHAQGEYRWKFLKLDELRVGGNLRVYRPNSAGTIFSDDTKRIINSEFGLYTGAEKHLLEDKLTLNATIRLDKNKNFDPLISPAISAVYSPKKNHFLRLSFSSALRNPTLSDQYLDLNVGPAILSGNLKGADSLITLNSFTDWRNTLNPDTLQYFNIAKIKPEQARSIEIGYRATLGEKVFVDASAYTTYYTNIIGYQIGIKADFDDTTGLVDFNSIKVYRYAANSVNTVITRGLNLGVNYYYYAQHAFTANYSYNKLVKTDENDPIIPAFNTPLHKFNIGMNARDWLKGKNGNSWGYAMNYKWVDKYFWEGSPQFTGPVPKFDLLDVQVNYTITKYDLNIKLGCSNILSNKHIEAYGGPLIGRMAYLTLLYEWKKI